jgi:hypothetical protein
MLMKLLKLAFCKDRRRDRRIDWQGVGILKIESTSLRGRVLDVSRGGFLFRPTMPTPILNSANATLTVNRLDCPAVIIRRGRDGLHCRFVNSLSAEDLDLLTASPQTEAEPPQSAPATATDSQPAAEPAKPAREISI